jgi:hypothetical protein
VLLCHYWEELVSLPCLLLPTDDCCCRLIPWSLVAYWLLLVVRVLLPLQLVTGGLQQQQGCQSSTDEQQVQGGWAAPGTYSTAAP